MDDRMQQEGGGELLCIRFKIFASNFCGIVSSKEQNLNSKTKRKIIKGDKDFTWKPSWPNKKEKPRPPGISKFSLCLGNQLQLHKTMLLHLKLLYSRPYSLSLFSLSISLLTFLFSYTLRLPTSLITTNHTSTLTRPILKKITIKIIT